MAMTAEEKQAWRTALGSLKHANETITIINAGSAGSLSTSAKKCIANAMANSQIAQSLILALTTGTALSYKAKRQIQAICGRKPVADSIITQINAIT